MDGDVAKDRPTTKLISGTPTGAQLALAFDGPLVPARLSLGYRLAAIFVLLAMLLLPVVYFAIVIEVARGVYWYATHAVAMFSFIPPGYVWFFAVLVYVTPLLAGSAVVVFLILPIFWRSKKRERPMWVDRNEQPLLFAYIDKLCETMNVPRPVRIDISASATASVHVENGWLSLLSRRLILTLGLPLAQVMDLKQFTSVIAHELGHFSQGGAMRLSYAVNRINFWFLRLAYTRSGVDEVLNSMLQGESSGYLHLMIGIAQLMLALTRLLLKLMAKLSHAMSMHLSRQQEFDADFHAGRIAGSEAACQALEVIPHLDTAADLALIGAKLGWLKRALPDDLVIAAVFIYSEFPATIQNKLNADLLAKDKRWFDTHPPLFERIGRLKLAKLSGAMTLNAPATCLFKDFDELSKLSTIRLYQFALGERLEPEHLVDTDLAALRKLVPKEPAKTVISTRKKVPIRPPVM